MQHDDWTAAIKKLMQTSGTRAGEWDAHLSDTQSAAKRVVGDWHIQQTLGFYADFLRSKGDITAAAELDTRIGDDAEAHITYWHVAAGTALAQAALDNFSVGNTDAAVKLAERAVSHFGGTADPSPIYEQLIAQLRSHAEQSL